MSKMKSRLGRGLSSLISVREELPALDSATTDPSKTIPATTLEVEHTIVVSNEPLNVPVTQVIPNPHQPRRVFSDASLVELAASLKANGVIQPVLVRREGDRYELIAGERRWRAAKLAGMETIPALVRDVDGLTQAQLALVENIQREDLNPMDRATGYRTLLTQLGLTQSELAGRLGEDRSSIANFLRLLELAPVVQQMVTDGVLSSGHGKVLAGITSQVEQIRLAELAVSQSLSVRNLERLATDLTGPTTTKVAKAQSAHLAELERNVARQLGLKVQIKTSGDKGRGKITLHYASLDQFDELMQRMKVDVET